MASFKLVSRSKPVAEQVEDILRERIHSGVYPPGERIPSEDNLAEELQVSRASIRSALTVMATEGLIIRRQGDGTYASLQRKSGAPIKRAWIFSDFLETAGRERQTRELERRARPADAREIESLGLNPGESVLAIRFLVSIDQKPVIYAAHAVRENAPFLQQEGQGENLPLTELIEVYDESLFGMTQIQFKGAVSNGEDVPEAIVPRGTPLVKIEAVLSDPDGQPLILVNEFHLREEGYLATIAHPVFQD
jgi:DNA-binding GntR family transcriptional regulator